MTESLFRFLLLRPPLAQDPVHASISLVQSTDFQKALATAAASTDPRQAMTSTSKSFIISRSFLASASASAFQKQVNVLSEMFDKLEGAGILDLKAVFSAVKQVFEQDPEDLVKSVDFVALLEGLRDSITAIKYVQEEHSRPIADLTNQLRDLELVQKAAEGTPSPAPSVTHSLTGDPKGTPEWREGQQYALHDHVTYEGLSYECIAPHLSHTRLAPPENPELWSAVEPIKSATPTKAVEFTTDAPWKTDRSYKVGDRVRYQGIIYVCLQVHKSQSDWTPALTPALWKALEAVPPEPPKIIASVYRKRSLLLPVEANLQSILAASVEERKKAEEERKKRAQDDEQEADNLLKKLADLKAAAAELIRLSPDHLEVKPQKEHPAIDIDEQFGRTRFLSNQLEYRSTLGKIALGRVTPAVAGAQAFASGQADPTPPVSTEPTGAFALAKDLLTSVAPLRPKGAWAPVPPEDRTPRLKSSTLSDLSPTTRGVLEERGININNQPVNIIVKTLRQEINKLLDALRTLAPSGDNVTYTRLGSAFIVTRSPIASRVTSLLYGNPIPRFTSALPALPLDGRIPHTKGKVTPAGVADLLVVKQTLKEYQATDVAHVENVLKGESMQRTNTATTRTETTIFTETETTRNEENELASTDRFEMGNETSNTLKEDGSLKGELKMSAKYGPAVSVDASLEGSVSRNKEEVTKTATKFSQDVTERTVKKITERALQRQSTTTINEIVEVNQHGFNNASGTGHISGVYQWLNKRYEAQVYNYGLRVMFEFMIPEPAAFLTYLTNALSTAAKSAEAAVLLERPATFDLEPLSITETSVGPLITKYQATDVLPPPEDYITVSDQSTFGGGGSNTDYDHAASITIPSGYQAMYATTSVVMNFWDTSGTVDVVVGGESNRFTANNAWVSGTNLISGQDGHDVVAGGAIAWEFNTWNVSDGVASVEVLCKVTDRRTQQWQAETHAKLITASKARIAEFEEKLAKIKLDTGIATQGTNPTANLVAIKSELKKGCISVLTAQHYDLFNSIATNPHSGYPEIDLYQAEAEGKYVRFFEQAFEWDQIMYITYPYFWARQDTWIKKLTFNDPDPVFDEFLKAGFARVVVPARPGFEGAIDHFMQLGEAWNGGPLPPISSPLYVSIADEVAERTRRPQGEIAQGEPWDVILPTTLIKLRADDKLPTFPEKT